MHISTMLIFWSLVRNSVVLAVYLLFSVARFFTVHEHSDEDIRTLIPDLLNCGVQIFNLQDSVNGIARIEENLKGKVCIVKKTAQKTKMFLRCLFNVL